MRDRRATRRPRLARTAGLVPYWKVFGFLASPCSRCTDGAYPVWRGAFCGLARCLAREYSAPARILVNRDAAFLGLLGLALDPEEPHWKPATCCNPLARPFPVADDHPAIEHAAAVTICGLAAKLEDDRRDENSGRRGVSRIARWMLTPAVDGALATLNGGGFPAGEVLDTLAGQTNLEIENPTRADEPTATAYAAFTGHLASITGTQASRARLEQLGRALGSLVYWRDAWVDRAEDERKGHFNAFLCLGLETSRTRIAIAWHNFREALAGLPLHRHALLLDRVRSATEFRHGDFLQSSSPPPPPPDPRADRREKKRKSDGSCSDCCCNPNQPSIDCCCDCACDTGRGDCGCIGLSPGDGCCCCPCN